jgi:hypothetical protein
MAKISKFKPDDGKLKELILLVSLRSENDPTFGAVKLNKLLFYCDFSAYLTFGSPITGQEYFKLKEGPAPRYMLPLTNKMQEEQELAFQRIPYFNHTQNKPIALRRPDIKRFKPEEISLIEQVIQMWNGKNATQISDESHLFIGWKVAREKETIPYSTALVGFREPTREEYMRGLELESLAVRKLSGHATA